MSDFASKEVSDQQKDFLKGLKETFGGFEMAIDQGYEQAMINYDILMREGQMIESMLKEFHALMSSDC